MEKLDWKVVCPRCIEENHKIYNKKIKGSTLKYLSYHIYEKQLERDYHIITWARAWNGSGASDTYTMNINSSMAQR